MRFSIIVPAYNVGSFLEKCINSVLEQSFSSYEILIINDGSTDNTLSIAENLSYESEGKLRIINQKNGGLSSARNKGIREAKGEYLIFLDGDDFWGEVNFLRDLDHIINDTKTDLIISPLSYYYCANNINYKTFTLDYDVTSDFIKDFSSLVINNIYTPSACNKCVRRELFFNQELYFPIGRLSEDVLWCGRLLEFVNSYYIYNKPCYMYRQNREGSITHKISEQNILHILISIDEGLKKYGIDENKLRNLEIYYSYSFIELIPYVYPYLNNSIISSILKRYKPLINYGLVFKEKKKVLISYLTKIFGFSIASLFLRNIVAVYRYLNNRGK